MTDSYDRLADIEDKWLVMPPSNLSWGQSDVKWLVTEVKHLRIEVEVLDAAWRSSEQQAFDDTQLIARLIGLLRKMRRADPPSVDLLAEVDETLNSPTL